MIAVTAAAFAVCVLNARGRAYTDANDMRSCCYTAFAGQSAHIERDKLYELSTPISVNDL